MSILKNALIAVIGTALALGLYAFSQIEYAAPVACTLDAKMCPDGSYVGRVGPSCEFAPCPPASVISNFEECLAAGYSVMESYPERCMTEDGIVFTREI